MCKSILEKYNNQDDYKLNLAAADITWTYLQDKFATTHYLNIIVAYIIMVAVKVV